MRELGVDGSGLSSLAAPVSVKFCRRSGLDYVSCSPLRVPIARFAAAQAALETPCASGKKKVGGTRSRVE